MDELIAFLRRCLDDDERAAQAAMGHTPRWATTHDDFAEHVARWDPARVLAEVDAKRALLAETIQPYLGADTTAARVAWIALRLLAQPYAGRDGWREEWTA